MHGQYKYNKDKKGAYVTEVILRVASLDSNLSLISI